MGGQSRVPPPPTPDAIPPQKKARSLSDATGVVTRLTPTNNSALASTPASAGSSPTKYGFANTLHRIQTPAPPSIDASAPSRVPRLQFKPTTTGTNRKLTISLAE